MPESRKNAGVVAVEFGLVAPLLLFLLTVTVDFGMAAYVWAEAQHAAQAGGQHAMRNSWDPAQISVVIATATGGTGISASPPPTLFCGCPTASGIDEIACAQACTDGSPAGQYGRISASTSYTALLPYPGLPRPLTLSGQAVVRLQ